MSESYSVLAKTHYENFPVGSLLLPKELKRAIHLVYAFARVADDIADEGNDTQEIRLAHLDEWENQLKRAFAGEKDDPFFKELAETSTKYAIPPLLFYDLIDAFRMDARGTKYKTFDDVLLYCRHSANPIGRILLYLLDCVTDETCWESDSLCTALQLTNFWQDLSIDIERNRLYIPSDDMERFGLTAEELINARGTGSVQALLKFEVGRTRNFFLAGKPLLHSIDKRFSFELRLTYNGGMRILEKVESLKDNILGRRPTLSKFDWFSIVARSLVSR